MAKYEVTASPYCTIIGEIEVPDDVTDAKAYIDEHFDNIKFGTPDLDYCGTDFDVEKAS